MKEAAMNTSVLIPVATPSSALNGKAGTSPMTHYPLAGKQALSFTTASAWVQRASLDPWVFLDPNTLATDMWASDAFLIPTPAYSQTWH